MFEAVSAYNGLVVVTFHHASNPLLSFTFSLIFISSLSLPFPLLHSSRIIFLSLFFNVSITTFPSSQWPDMAIPLHTTKPMHLTVLRRTGIKFAIDWLVDVMERSKRTEMLRVRAGVTGHV
ncbi:ADP-ribosylation factor-related protein [Musa troglodytarum]|uniref:ADP-ribosylation factor-related protein n=1 Tax=Musa troglodytarum TaxID=320322 RepID=A0A9E7K461_9LILI|nr:ADP-ribosylation factor-related protein [Musa troglodytarum]URE02660.1 ADP-ribosylation factor-related protein [Musa troglodytarum]